MYFLISHPTWAPFAFVLACLAILVIFPLVFVRVENSKCAGAPVVTTQAGPYGLGIRWPEGQSPLALFNEGAWLPCANAIMICLADIGDRRMTQDAISDNGLLRELILLEAGQGSSIPLDDLQDEVEEIEALHGLQARVAMAGIAS